VGRSAQKFVNNYFGGSLFIDTGGFQRTGGRSIRIHHLHDVPFVVEVDLYATVVNRQSSQSLLELDARAKATHLLTEETEITKPGGEA